MSAWVLDEKAKTVRAVFASTEEFARAVAAAENSPKNAGRRDSGQQPYTRSWDDMVPTVDAWQKLIATGWTEGAEKASRMAEGLGVFSATSAIRPEMYFADEGDCVDIGRYLEGDDECWQAQRDVPSPAAGRVATVVLSSSLSAGVDAKNMQAAAVIVAALVDALESAGQRVELHVTYCCCFGVYKGEVTHTVKRAEDPLDLVRVCGALHVATFRRGWFRLAESCPVDIGRGYGCPIEPEPGRWPEGAIVVHVNEVYRKGAAWIRETARTLLGAEAVA